MSIINNKHLQSHGITAEQYRERYPDAVLVSEQAKENLHQRSIRSNAARKGKPRSEKDLRAIRAGIAAAPTRIAHNKGQPMSEEMKTRISVIHKEAFASGKRIHHNLGKSHPDDTREKISKSLTGRKADPQSAKKATATKIANGVDLGASMRGKKHSEETKALIGRKSSEIHQRKREEIRSPMISKISESNLTLLNTLKDDVFQLQCNSCSFIFTRTPQMFQPSKWHSEVCDQCYPISPVSKAETEVADFIRQFSAITCSDMEIITPLELDIVVEENKLAIEYCGIYWHSERAGKKPWYHRKKLDLANEAGYRLITIFEDEWINKRPIVESMIAGALGQTRDKLSARKCVVRTISSKDGRTFIEANHLQGGGRANVYYGLFLDDILVSVMSFSNSELSRKSTGWDINRFCSLLNTSVRGAAGKLFQAFIRDHNPESVLSYADLRYGTGGVYGQLGFVHIGNTVPNYWYFKNGSIKRYHRFGLRKNSSDDQSLTEWENRQLQGWDRIWDCGHAKWQWTKALT